MHVMMAGATGLVGGYVLDGLLECGEVETISLLVRRDVPHLLDEKAKTIRTDFTDLEKMEPVEGVDIMVCALGTTIKKAGSKERLFEIDCLYTEAAARYAKRCGAKHVLVVSSVGSSTRASSHYLRTKGDMERRLKAIGFDGCHIFRPSLLLGERNENRFGETLAIYLMKPLSILMPASYRPIDAENLAGRMVDVAMNPDVGVHVYIGKDLL